MRWALEWVTGCSSTQTTLTISLLLCQGGPMALLFIRFRNGLCFTGQTYLFFLLQIKNKMFVKNLYLKLCLQ